MQKICIFLVSLSSILGCGIADNNIITNLPVEKKEVINEIKSILEPQERKNIITTTESTTPVIAQVKNIVNSALSQTNLSPLVKPETSNNSTNSTKSEPIFFDSGGSSYVIPSLSITDVIRLDTNQSIVGINAPASLTYSPTTPIKLKITGNNFSDLTEPQKWGFYLVGYDPDILIETFIKKPIKKKVLIDDCIVLQPDPQGTFSQTELNVIFDSNGVLDASLTGLHSLKVYDGQKVAEVKIKFDKPDKKYNFQPTIQELGIRDLELGKKMLEITGPNYFLDYKRNWVQIDSKRAYIHKVEVLKGVTEIKQMKAKIYLPSDFVRNEGQNTINFATPYGSVLKMF